MELSTVHTSAKPHHISHHTKTGPLLLLAVRKRKWKQCPP